MSDTQNPSVGKSPRDAAAYLRSAYGESAPTEQTLARYRYDVGRGKPNLGPRFHRMGPKSVFYFQADLDAWATGAPDQPLNIGRKVLNDTVPATPKNGPEPETRRQHRARRAGRPKSREPRARSRRNDHRFRLNRSPTQMRATSADGEAMSEIKEVRS
jgi:hypothetical protein